MDHYSEYFIRNNRYILDDPHNQTNSKPYFLLKTCFFVLTNGRTYMYILINIAFDWGQAMWVKNVNEKIRKLKRYFSKSIRFRVFLVSKEKEPSICLRCVLTVSTFVFSLSSPGVSCRNKKFLQLNTFPYILERLHFSYLLRKYWHTSLMVKIRRNVNVGNVIKCDEMQKFELLIHSASPQSRPDGIIVFAHVVRPSVPTFQI